MVESAGQREKETGGIRGKKKESHKGREEDERAAKASVGRHTKGAEWRTINVRTTTSRWLAGRTVGHRRQNPHRDARIRD